MKVNAIIFSPSGGTKKVSDAVVSAFEKKGEEIDISLQDFGGYKANSQDFYIISAPTFSSRIPEIVRENLEKINGNGARAAVLVAYGNRGFDDSLLELYDLCISCGFKVVAGIAASTEHSIFRDFATGRPDNKDKAQLKDFGLKIQEKIENNDLSDIDIPGSRPYMERIVSTIRPEVNDKCISCLTCANSCPVKAIPKDNPKLTDDGSCIACMRCIAVCPSGARNLNPKVRELGNKTMEDKLNDRKENHLFL